MSTSASLIHSKSAHYAGGLTVEEQIDALNAKLGQVFRIFKGVESDILPDGSLDYPDEVLARFDFVVASVHGQFRLNKTKQTERILRAVANPFTTILGHMTGRQLCAGPVMRSTLRRFSRRVRGTVLPWRSTPIRGVSIWTGGGIAVHWSSVAP